MLCVFGFVKLKEGRNTVKEGIDIIDNISTYKKISSEDAKKRIDQGEDIVILDVRTNEEYKSGHIKGSIVIPLNELSYRVESEITDKNRTIFVYCRSGNRSEEASNQLIKMGYKNVFDLGGIISWKYDIEI